MLNQSGLFSVNTAGAASKVIMHSTTPMNLYSSHELNITSSLNNLKIGKGFVLFEINSSPSAFYIIKPTIGVNLLKMLVGSD